MAFIWPQYGLMRSRYGLYTATIPPLHGHDTANFDRSISQFQADWKNTDRQEVEAEEEVEVEAEVEAERGSGSGKRKWKWKWKRLLL